MGKILAFSPKPKSAPVKVERETMEHSYRICRVLDGVKYYIMVEPNTHSAKLLLNFMHSYGSLPEVVEVPHDVAVLMHEVDFKQVLLAEMGVTKERE